MRILYNMGRNGIKMEKPCKICFQVKPLSEFYESSSSKDGHLNKCKPCAREMVSIHRQNNIDRIRKLDVERWHSADRRIKKSCSVKIEGEKLRIRNSARRAVGKKVKRGKLKRQPCQICGTNNFVHAHHEDYSKRFDVVWLCATHHKLRHVELKKLGVEL